jgi:hypothetical protein
MSCCDLVTDGVEREELSVLTTKYQLRFGAREQTYFDATILCFSTVKPLADIS